MFFLLRPRILIFTCKCIHELRQNIATTIYDNLRRSRLWGHPKLPIHCNLPDTPFSRNIYQLLSQLIHTSSRLHSFHVTFFFLLRISRRNSSVISIARTQLSLNMNRNRYACPPWHECKRCANGKPVSERTMLRHRAIANAKRAQIGRNPFRWGPKLRSGSNRYEISCFDSLADHPTDDEQAETVESIPSTPSTATYTTRYHFNVVQ